MTRKNIVVLLSVCWMFVFAASAARAENEGQEDLDKATELQLSAKSLANLEEVAALCESALKKGLDKGNEQFAKQLLSSTLYQHGKRLTIPIFDQTPPDRRWPVLRGFALKDLERAVEVAPQLGDAHLLICRLELLPGGNRERAKEAIDRAIEVFADDEAKQSAAFVIRAQLRDDVEQRMKDYDRAIEADPSNSEAWQARALTLMQQGKFEAAIESFNSLLAKNEENVDARLALAEALTNLEKYEEARKQIDKAIELEPDSSLAYTLRARLHLIEENNKAAMDDLNQALKLQPRYLSALLVRARLHQADGNSEAAMDDVERVLLISPGLPQALVMRSLISAAQGNINDAIGDMRTLVDQQPDNIPWQLQLASFYIQDRRPSKAIDIFTKVLSTDEGNAMARQARANTLLSMGRHAEAIEDFNVVVKQEPDNDSILNNLAWVLATSPEDELRDGQRAIKLATKACEVTDYKKPHILSTLAAAYAETGDFETAIKWSTKAVELGAQNDEVDEQLKNELESYKKKKPWREKQTVDEKEDPLQQRRSSFET